MLGTLEAVGLALVLDESSEGLLEALLAEGVMALVQELYLGCLVAAVADATLKGIHYLVD